MDSKVAINGHEADDFDYESTSGSPNEQSSSTPPSVNGKNLLIFLFVLIQGKYS